VNRPSSIEGVEKQTGSQIAQRRSRIREHGVRRPDIASVMSIQGADEERLHAGHHSNFATISCFYSLPSEPSRYYSAARDRSNF
jgi:hypothetical protein